MTNIFRYFTDSENPNLSFFTAKKQNNRVTNSQERYVTWRKRSVLTLECELLHELLSLVARKKKRTSADGNNSRGESVLLVAPVNTEKRSTLSGQLAPSRPTSNVLDGRDNLLAINQGIEWSLPLEGVLTLRLRWRADWEERRSKQSKKDNNSSRITVSCGREPQGKVEHRG